MDEIDCVFFSVHMAAIQSLRSFVNQNELDWSNFIYLFIQFGASLSFS